jgi:hypothetical protein
MKSFTCSIYTYICSSQRSHYVVRTSPNENSLCPKLNVSTQSVQFISVMDTSCDCLTSKPSQLHTSEWVNRSTTLKSSLLLPKQNTREATVAEQTLFDLSTLSFTWIYLPFSTPTSSTDGTRRKEIYTIYKLFYIFLRTINRRKHKNDLKQYKIVASITI